MTITESKLKENLTVFEFLQVLAMSNTSQPDSKKKIQVDNITSDYYTLTTRDTIQYCEEHGFVEVNNLNTLSTEYILTDKGLAYYALRSEGQKAV